MAIAVVMGSASPQEKPETATHGPKLQLDSRKVNFGEIEGGKWYVDSVGFTNTGDSVLVIRNIFSGCGCTAASFSDGPIAPGERGMIKVKYRGSTGAAGPFHKTVRVRSNAINHSEIIFVEGVQKIKKKKED